MPKPENYVNPAKNRNNLEFRVYEKFRNFRNLTGNSGKPTIAEGKSHKKEKLQRSGNPENKKNNFTLKVLRNLAIPKYVIAR